MEGLLQSAWLGWREYITDGKLAALLLAAVLYLLLGRKRGGRSFLVYTAVAAVCCILPVTAALLMMYQTGFYGYRRIWSLVPATAVTAYGIAVVVTERWPDFKPANWRRGAPVAALALGAVLLSAGAGAWDMEGEERERRQADAVLGLLMEICPDGEVYLWAPREIMEYARETDASVRLVYGRDMWDSSLIGYTYDNYDESKVFMYDWMEMEPGGRTWEMNMLATAQAREEGVNCILLPKETNRRVISYMGKVLGAEIRLVGSYYYIIVDTGDDAMREAGVR